VKVSSGGPWGERPRTGRFLIYADDYGSRRDFLQSRVVQLDGQLDALRQTPARPTATPFPAPAVNAPPPDPKSKQQTAPEQEASFIKAQRQQLEREKIDLTAQLNAEVFENVKLDWGQCSGSRDLAQTFPVRGPGAGSERARPIPASLGEGVAPRGIDTEAPPRPRTSIAGRLPPWWPVGLGTLMLGVGSLILTHRRRSARSAGDSGSTP